MLSNTSGVPIYAQIKDHIATAIIAGDLAEGESLPSLRRLARDLRVSVITTTRAYSDLAAEGFITNVPGKGAFVLPSNPELLQERALADTETALLEAIAVAKRGGLDQQAVTEMIAPLWQFDDEGN